MRWPLHRHRTPPTHPQGDDDEAQAALAAARTAAAKAQRDLDDMRSQVAETTRQREQNHFAPLILELMKRR
jgi:hypothetical protein